MSGKQPRSLRGETAQKGATAAALLAAGTAAAVSTEAHAQGAGVLPPVTVDAPVVRQRPTLAPRPTATQTRARTALRRQTRQPAATRAPIPGPVAGAPAALPILAQEPNANPYAQPGVPYKANRVQDRKFSEPLINTPRTITVLPKEVLADKGATTLREIGRSTAGVTLGTGEGGNAFGDRFFIRGFDARNDVFVDGIRDPGLSIRENFFTEQVEILRGPGSSYAGRGTTGGALNIVTKQATTDRDFRIIEAQGGPSDNQRRVTFDVNQAISPILALRGNFMFQNSGVAGRNYVIDNRWGSHVAAKFQPFDNLTLTATYTHTDMSGLPDFGVPYLRFGTNRPFTEGLVNRNTYYGFINRDFQKARQDIVTITGEYKFNENISLSNKFRREKSVLDYVGTLAEGFTPASRTINYNSQSRYQTVGVVANQTELTVKADTGPIRHTSIAGIEFSHEQIQRDIYAGLRSEGLPGGVNGTSTAGSPFFPNNTLAFSTPPRLLGNPTYIPIDTKSAYLIHTANYNDFIIANGGVRYDDYDIASFTPLQAVGIGGSPLTSIAKNRSRMVNYNAGVVVKPLPYWSLYFSHATSSNPVGAEVDGTTAQYGGLNQPTQIFGPERNKAYEVGSKFELFDRRLLLSGALFRTEKANAREIVGAGTASNVTATAAYAVQGIDIEVAGKITDRWSVIGGFVAMQTKVTKSSYPSNVGLPLANVAHTSFSMLSKYAITDFLEVGGQAVFNSRRYGGTYLAANGSPAFNNAGLPAPTAANPYINVPTILPAYWRFDSFAEMKVGAFKGRFAVYNIFNRTYYDSFYQSAAPFAVLAPGRTIQFTATATF